MASTTTLNDVMTAVNALTETGNDSSLVDRIDQIDGALLSQTKAIEGITKTVAELADTLSRIGEDMTRVKAGVNLANDKLQAISSQNVTAAWKAGMEGTITPTKPKKQPDPSIFAITTFSLSNKVFKNNKAQNQIEINPPIIAKWFCTLATFEKTHKGIIEAIVDLVADCFFPIKEDGTVADPVDEAERASRQSIMQTMGVWRNQLQTYLTYLSTMDGLNPSHFVGVTKVLEQFSTPVQPSAAAVGGVPTQIHASTVLTQVQTTIKSQIATSEKKTMGSDVEFGWRLAALFNKLDGTAPSLDAQASKAGAGKECLGRILLGPMLYMRIKNTDSKATLNVTSMPIHFHMFYSSQSRCDVMGATEKLRFLTQRLGVANTTTTSAPTPMTPGSQALGGH
jgi:uncharacterized coiled-coil protein SlyX